MCALTALERGVDELSFRVSSNEDETTLSKVSSETCTGSNVRTIGRGAAVGVGATAVLGVVAGTVLVGTEAGALVGRLDDDDVVFACFRCLGDFLVVRALLRLLTSGCCGALLTNYVHQIQ